MSFQKALGILIKLVKAIPFLEHVPYVGPKLKPWLETMRANDPETVKASAKAAEIKILTEISQQMSTFRHLEVYNQLHILFMAAAVALIKRLADDVSRIAGSLAGIEQNIESVHARGDHFPAHVYLYIKLMTDRYSGERHPHYFAVFNKGTQWHAKFADLQRQNPLGAQYLGHMSDLDELVIFLKDTVRPKINPKATIHILMPTVGPLAIPEAVKFPEELHPFQVHGQLGHQGVSFVWLCLTEAQDRQALDGIGLLKQREIWVMKGRAGVPLPILWNYLSVDLETQYFVDPTYRVQTSASLLVAGTHYYCAGLEPPRELGQRMTRPWN